MVEDFGFIRIWSKKKLGWIKKMDQDFGWLRLVEVS